MKSKAFMVCLFLTAFAVIFAVPEVAFAASPFSSAASSLKSDATTVFQIIAFIGVMAVGVLCMMGRINKAWLFACVLGIILIFGADQIITWIRGAGGV